MTNGEKMSAKVRNSRISIPGKIVNLLLYDDEFFREVSSLKKANIVGSFPKYDQWCDSEGTFHMEFALAGYSPSDLEISISGNEFNIRTSKPEYGEAKSQEEDPSLAIKDPQPKIQQGAILRGIARRNFSCSFYISQDFDISNLKAVMENGLLHVIVPAIVKIQTKVIKINSGE
jgi:HSP20 family molecular chaperone IbpA